MAEITTESGFIIEYTPLSKKEDISTVVNGSVIGYNGWEKSLTVPEEFEYIDKNENVIKGKIVSIGISAFENYNYLEKIVIPDTVTTVDKFAFKKCTSLEYISLPNTIEEISDYCFINCSGLKTVVLKEGLKKIGDYSFSGCSSLPSIEIPDSCYFIGFSAFEKCKSLREVNLPKGIKVDYFAFKDSGFEKKYSNLSK